MGGKRQMKMQKIHHVAILVEDLEKAGKLYSDLFGIEFTSPKEEKELDIRNMLSPQGIELVSPLTPDGVMAKNLERRGEGITLLAFTVDNVAEASAEISAKGIRQIGGDGTKLAIFHPKDLNGVTIELTKD